jgi:RNA-directed DNA polymerase
MGKGGSERAARLDARRPLVNTGAPLPGLEEAQQRVLDVQRKLHEWASCDAERRFCDLWNLVCDPATLVVAWSRVSRNRGSRTAGIDGKTRRHVEQIGVARFLAGLRGELKSGEFRPLAVRERLIPKRDGTMRRLGIPTLKDRVVQMALKLVMEPLFEADFYPSSYGYRPGRRAQDAIAEIVHFTKAPSHYEWVVEADIEACFDRLSHSLILEEVRRRIVDKRVLALARAFLKAGVMRETGGLQRSVSGTPQGGIASPLLANIALNALDRRYEADWRAMGSSATRSYRRRQGHATWRLIRYADDAVVLVKGSRAQAQAQLDELNTRVLALGLKLKPEKTRLTHIDAGFVFLGQRIIRRQKGTTRHVYTFVCDEALASIKRKVKALTGRRTTNLDLSALLCQLNPVLRGWAGYFRFAAAKSTLSYVGHFAWWRVVRWLRKKHPRMTWKQLRRRYMGGGWTIQAGTITLFNPRNLRVERYRYRGRQIQTPWTETPRDPTHGRYRRARYDDHAFLGYVQEALA